MLTFLVFKGAEEKLWQFMKREDSREKYVLKSILKKKFHFVVSEMNNYFLVLN